RLQRLALHKFHGDIEEALILAGIIDRDDVGMRKDTSRLRLLPEAHQQFRITGVQRYGLDGNGAADGWIEAAVYHAHGTPTQLFNNLVTSGLLEHSGSLCWISSGASISRCRTFRLNSHNSLQIETNRLLLYSPAQTDVTFKVLGRSQ